MSSSIPTVSIGLPVYNGERYLAGAIQSLLGQDYQNFELIISDNASTDGTEEICRSMAAQEPRIRYFRNAENIGATRNYNRVFQLSRGAFFKWASHDDECHTTLIRRCLEVYKECPPSTVLVYPKSEIIDERGAVKHLAPDDISCRSDRAVKRFAKVLFSSSFANPLWGLIRSDALKKTRLMGVIEADHVLLGELSLIGQLIEFPEVLYRMRRHERCATEINKSAKALLAWHDPSRANERILLPHWERTYIEYLKGVHHASLRPISRILCYGAVPLVSYWRRTLRWTGPVRKKLGLARSASGAFNPAQATR
jgi:glycosyltransferase involved in cell wall biosynthesis